MIWTGNPKETNSRDMAHIIEVLLNILYYPKKCPFTFLFWNLMQNADFLGGGDGGTL